MGFKLPERKGIADFLQEVTSQKDQAQYWAKDASSYRFIPVFTLTFVSILFVSSRAGTFSYHPIHRKPKAPQ